MKSEFSRLVKRRRTELGLSQARLAERVGRSASTVRKWERGSSQPNDDALVETLAEVLAVDGAELRRAVGLAGGPSPIAVLEDRDSDLPGQDPTEAAAETPKAESSASPDVGGAPEAGPGLPPEAGPLPGPGPSDGPAETIDAPTKAAEPAELGGGVVATGLIETGEAPRSEEPPPGEDQPPAVLPVEEDRATAVQVGPSDPIVPPVSAAATETLERVHDNGVGPSPALEEATTLRRPTWFEMRQEGSATAPVAEPTLASLPPVAGTALPKEPEEFPTPRIPRPLRRSLRSVLEPEESTVPEPDPFLALRKHAVLVVLLIGLFGGLGVMFAYYQPPTYVATATMVLEDPQSSALTGTVRAADAERYVANQVALLESVALAERASELAKTSDDPRVIDPGQFITNANVSVASETEFVAIEFEAGDAVTAQVGANSIALAYQEAVRGSLEEEFQNTAENLDGAIDGVLSQIDTLQAQIDELRSGNEDRAALDAQVSDIVSELARLRTSNPIPSDFDVKVEQLTAELNVRLMVGELEAQQGPAAVLLRQQADAFVLLSELSAQRREIDIARGLSGDGVAFFSAAESGQPKGISRARALLFGGVLGALFGAGLSYWLEARKWRFSSRLEPERILDAPSLAQIPDFGEERVGSALPVRDAPSTVSAEAFRFVMVGLDPTHHPGDELGSPSPNGWHRSIAVASAAVGDGKSTIAANTALAAAHEGLRVLAFDADISSQSLTNLLVDDPGRAVKPGLGITDIVAAGERYEDVVNVVPVSRDANLNVLAFGRTHVDPIRFFRSADAREALDSLRDDFDLLLIDLPPILHIAYTAALLRLVDDVVVVVPHGSESAQLREVHDRLNLLGIEPIGFIYNRAPLGRRLRRTGSLSAAEPSMAAARNQ